MAQRLIWILAIIIVLPMLLYREELMSLLGKSMIRLSSENGVVIIVAIHDR